MSHINRIICFFELIEKEKKKSLIFPGNTEHLRHAILATKLVKIEKEEMKTLNK